MKTNSDNWWPDVLSIGKTQNVSKIIVYNLYKQKRFFVDVTLKSSMAHYRLTTFGYFATFSSSKRHHNSYLVAQTFFGYCNFHTDDLSVAKSLKLPDLILSLLRLLKTPRGYKTFFFFFAHSVILWNLWLLNFGLLLNFRDVTVTLSQNILIFVSNTSQLIGLFILVGLGRSFFVCCLAHRGSTVSFLLLQCSSGVVRQSRDLQVSVATRSCRVLIFASS